MTDTIHILHCGFCNKPFPITLDPARDLPETFKMICTPCYEQEQENYKREEEMADYHYNTDLTQRLYDQHADSPVVLEAIGEIRRLRFFEPKPAEDEDPYSYIPIRP